jgi:uncharacterized membrane protein
MLNLVLLQPVKTVFAVFEGIFTAGYSGSRLLMFVGDYNRAISSFKAIQVSSILYAGFKLTSR